MTPAFNLLDEPWIPVRSLAGEVREVGLLELFERWGIGDRARDDGLLVLLVRDRRTVRMHTGYGLEGLLPDLLCHRIEQQFMKPAFKDGRYGEGLRFDGERGLSPVRHHGGRRF